MSKYTFRNEIYKARGWPRNDVQVDKEGWLHGSIITRLGIVSVNGRQAGNRAWHPGGLLFLRAIHDGRQYHRRIIPCPSLRGITTMAHRWLKEIVLKETVAEAAEAAT